jgi:Aldos-2-ulose dehydratase, beta-propeller domain
MTKRFDTREWIGSAVAPTALAIGLIAAVGAADHRQDPPSSTTPAADPHLRFRAQEIVKDFGVGYAVVAGDVNGDKRTDILAISGTELVWFEAPTWEKRVILGAGATTADNVTLAPHDIDGDGDLDIALGAGWTKENTGTLQWVRQNAPGAARAWDVFPISAETTLHRIKWADADGDKKLDLIVAPLHGKGAKGPEWDGPAARLLVFKPPAHPDTDQWSMEVAGESNHIQHNVLPMQVDTDPADEIVTASKEGLTAFNRSKDGTWSHTVIGEGAPGEVKLGRVDGRRMLATVEPWHGAGIAIYAEQPGTWAKTTIERALTEGHALGWADFDGDGSDELAAGWRRGPAPGIAIYVVTPDGALVSKTMVDQGGIDPNTPDVRGMDTEDLIVGDFNGDARPDIVASGRATKNIKIYWNETPKKKRT